MYQAMRVFIVWFFVFTVSLFAQALEYADFNKSITIHKGWNLLSLPVDKTFDTNETITKFNKTDAIWSYDKGWMTLSPNGKYSQALKEANFPSIKHLPFAKGFWVYSNTDKNISFYGNAYKQDYELLPKGWHLLGTGSDIIDLNTTFKDVDIVWSYTNGKWKAFSTHSKILQKIKDADIDILDHIKAAEGFWVYKNSITFKNHISFGLISDAHISSYLLSDTDTPVSEATVDDKGEFNLTFNSDINQSRWIVSKVTDGVLRDIDFDGIEDNSTLQNSAVLHLLSTVKDISNGIHISILSEIAYTLIKDRIDEYNTTYTPQTDLDYIALSFFAHDIDGDGIIGYKDILHFTRKKSSHLKALKFDINLLNAKLDDNQTIYEKIEDSTLQSSDVLQIFGNSIMPPKPTKLITANIEFNIPTNTDDINQSDVKIQSLASKDLKVYKEKTTLLIAEDDDNATLFLGYAIPSSLQNTLLRKRGLRRASTLYKTNPSNIEISPRSTALSLTMMLLQSGLNEKQKTELASVVLSDDNFQELQNMIEVAFKLNSKFLDKLMLYPDIVAQIKATATSAWQIYTDSKYQETNTTQASLPRVLHKTGAGIDWGWYDDTLWYWYGEANGYNITGAPFLATSNNGSVISLANPTLINYVAKIYNKAGVALDTKLVPRNSTLLQKEINKGAAGRIINIDPNAIYIEYYPNAWTRILNTLHLAVSIFDTVASGDFIKPLADLAEQHELATEVSECFVDLVNTGDFTKDDPENIIMGYIKLNWTSIFETGVDCLINSKYIMKKAGGFLMEQIKKIPIRGLKASATLTAKGSNPIGWVWIAAQAINGPLPIATSWVFSPSYAGYDIQWNENYQVSDITTATQPPKAPLKPVAKIVAKDSTPSPLTWSFDASSSKVDSKSDTIDYRWNIEGEIYTTSNVTHTFETKGKKRVTLTITDEFHQKDTKKIYINATDGYKPIISSFECSLSQDPKTINLSWSLSDKDDDIQTIKVYKSPSDTNPQILNASDTITTLTYENTQPIGQIYNPHIEVTDAQNHKVMQNCLVSAEIKYNFGVNLNKGLVAHYEFEGDANDSSGNSNDGTEHGGVEYVDGVIGKAAKFDGVDDYIEVMDNDLLDLASTFTISVWVKQYGSQSQGYRLIDKTTAGVNDGYLFDTCCGNNGQGIRLGGGADNTCANSGFNLNEWHHLLVTFDNQISKFYLDGIYVGSGNHGSDISKNSLNLRIGFSQGTLSNNEYFYGVMDDLRIYNRALNEDEIKALYKLGQPKVELDKGLVAHYEFEGDAKDSSGNGNDGTQHGGVEYVDGVIGKAAKFDGVDDYIEANKISVSKYNNFYVSAWIKVNDFTTCNASYNDKMTIFYSRNDGYPETALNIKLNDKQIALRREGFNNLTTSYTTTKGKWINVGYLFKNTSVSLYVNGEKISTVVGNSSSNTDSANKNIPFWIGKINAWWGEGYCFNGLIDDLRIYNRALNNDEIKALYKLGQPKVELDKGLVAHYEFEGDAKDSSGNGNDGTQYGGVEYVDGVIGKAAKFDGVDDYIDLNKFNYITSGEYFSVNIWTKANPQNRMLISQYDTVNNQRAWQIVGRDTGEFAVYLAHTGTTSSVKVANTKNTFLDGQWHMITLIWDRGEIKLYIDNVFASLDYTANPSFIDITNLNANILLSTREKDGKYAWNGLVDDVRIYNRALNEQEVKALYNLKQ